MPCALQATSAKHFTRLATQLARTSGSLARSRATMACCCVLAKRALNLTSASFNKASHKVNLQTTSMKKMASWPAKHGALRCIVQCIRRYSQSILFRPLWALQTTSAKHRVLQWLLHARFTIHFILLQLRLLIPCLSSHVVASWLTLRIC